MPRAPLEDGHGLHVEGLREEVHGGGAHRLEGTLLLKAGEVSGEGRRVAAHVGDGAGRLLGELGHHLLGQARARRVDHDDVGVGVRKLQARVAADGVHVVKPRLVEVTPQVTNGRTIGLHGGDEACAASQGQREGSRAAVEVHGLLVRLRVEPLHDELHEPLGALDLKLRKEMQLELKRLQREMNITFVYVTHDQEEALTMSDTVVVMSGGKIQQIGSPQDIYNEPKNAFVARFIGDSNIVDGVMLRDFYVNFGGHDFTCVDRGFKPNEPVQVVIRPEDVQIVPPSVGMLTGLVREVIFKGVHFEMHVDVEGYEWIIHSTQASQPGELIGMNIGPDEIHIMKRSEV